MKVKKKRVHILPTNKWYAVLVLLMMLVSAAFIASMSVVKVIPFKMTMGILAILFGLLILTWVLLCRKKRALRIIGLLLAILFITAFSVGAYYLGSTYAMFARMSNEDAVRTTDNEGIDVTKDSFNIYVTGIDQWNGWKGMDLERSDVNMIVTVCPSVHKVLLTSIPRDSYVVLHRTGTYDKLTHTGIYGVDETLNTVEDWLGINLNYYVKLNFSSARDIVDAIGGVDVYSPVAFGSSISDYTYDEGWNHLDGEQALYFARERKSFEGKDSLRVENQQRVVKACIEKMTSSTTLLTRYSDIVEAAGWSFQTSMSSDAMQQLVKMQLSDLTGWDIQTQKIEGDYDMDYVASLTQESKFLVYKTYPDSVKECVDAINSTMNPPEEEVKAYIDNKNAQTMKNLLKRFFNKDKKTEETDENTEG